jgi:hypothetical protein
MIYACQESFGVAVNVVSDDLLSRCSGRLITSRRFSRAGDGGTEEEVNLARFSGPFSGRLSRRLWRRCGVNHNAMAVPTAGNGAEQCHDRNDDLGFICVSEHN